MIGTALLDRWAAKAMPAGPYPETAALYANRLAILRDAWDIASPGRSSTKTA
jgi:hypothetical protein